MRGTDKIGGSLLSHVDIEDRIPARHPLRQVTRIVDDALVGLDAQFARLPAAEGRPSIPPERLMRARLIQLLFSVRSERQLMEQMQYNLLLRWVVGLGADDAVWAPTVFTRNRDRLPTTDMPRKKIEEPFGWAKTIGGMAQTVLRGLDRVRARFALTMAANDRARSPKPLAARARGQANSNVGTRDRRSLPPLNGKPFLTLTSFSGLIRAGCPHRGKPKTYPTPPSASTSFRSGPG